MRNFAVKEAGRRSRSRTIQPARRATNPVGFRCRVLLFRQLDRRRYLLAAASVNLHGVLELLQKLIPEPLSAQLVPCDHGPKKPASFACLIQCPARGKESLLGRLTESLDILF